MQLKKYILVDNRHPRFNVWKRVIANGNSYLECFWKDVNPNNIFVRWANTSKEATNHGKKWPYFKNNNLDRKKDKQKVA